MPGYRALPESFAGLVADLTRRGERFESEGNAGAALVMYEEALVAALAESEVLPGFLCGRLAQLYRQRGRYADEVALLERYEASQVTDDNRVRFRARLSKARALLEKSLAKGDNGALSSVRAIGPSKYDTRRMRQVP